MANRLIAMLNAREDGPIHNFLRYLSLFCCLGSILTAALAFRLFDNVATDGDGQALSISLIIPGCPIAVWTSIYLILNALRVPITLPVTLTFDLLAWLYALAMGVTGAALSAIADSPYRCPETPGCEDWMPLKPVVVACVTLLFIVACVPPLA
jgi:hypothetical protein